MQDPIKFDIHVEIAPDGQVTATFDRPVNARYARLNLMNNGDDNFTIEVGLDRAGVAPNAGDDKPTYPHDRIALFNDRLKKLLDLNAPDVLIKNEKDRLRNTVVAACGRLRSTKD